MSALVLFGSLAILLIIGVPISVSLGMSTLATLLFLEVPLSVLGQRIFTGLDSISIMAIPFFVLAGNLMTKGGISRTLVNLSNSVIGNLRGGMAYAMILACAFFAALSGSAPATVIAIGSMLYPEMIKLGYPKGRAAGLLTVSGGLGPIIPPSIIMVVYSTITNSSVGDLFKAGIVAGSMIAVILFIVSFYLSHKEKWPKNEHRISLKEFLKSFIKAIPAILLPVIVLGGIYSGYLTPTESAATAVVYSFIIGVFVYREINIKDLICILIDSGKSSAMLLFIIATSTAFSWIFTFSGISGELVEAISGLDLSPVLLCLIMSFIFLIFGTFLEGIATCVLLVPVLWPVANSVGINPIHFGIIVAISNVIGTMTPPVAVNIFAAVSVSKLKIGEIAKGEIPFFIGYTFVFVIIVIFPWFSTFFLK